MKKYIVQLDDVTAKIFETIVDMTNRESDLNITQEDAIAEIITQFVQQNYMRYAGYVRRQANSEQGAEP